MMTWNSSRLYLRALRQYGDQGMPFDPSSAMPQAEPGSRFIQDPANATIPKVALIVTAAYLSQRVWKKSGGAAFYLNVGSPRLPHGRMIFRFGLESAVIVVASNLKPAGG